MAANSPKRILWLDILRILCAVEIVGFHWLRAVVKAGALAQNMPFNFVLNYRQLSWGVRGLRLLFLSHNPSVFLRIIDNITGILFEFGWEAVHIFVLLSGFSLAMTLGRASLQISWRPWLFRRLERVLIPFYLVSLPLVLLMLGLLQASRHGLAKAFATKLMQNGGGDFPGILWAQLFLFDPRHHMLVPTFLAPAWWFVPAILVAYLVFPLIWFSLNKCGAPLTLALALCVSVLTYTAVEHQLLFEFGWYFAAFNEAFNFSLGIVLGKLYATQEGAAWIERQLRSRWVLAAAAGLAIIGNLCNLYLFTYPISSSLFTIGLTICGIWVARWLSKSSFWVWLSSVDSYVLYLVHQPFAFPIVMLLLKIRCPDLASLGLILYLTITILIASLVTKFLHFFERMLRAKSIRPPVA